jgi:hypothetical protein
MERKRSAYKMLVRNLKEEGHQEEVGVDGSIIFKYTLKY